MGVKNIIQAVKKVHTEYIVLVKEGSFYHIYGKDAYIISYLFGYKIKEIENMNVCGSPINSINRIVAKLETNKINYLILDKRNNYDIEEIYNNKNLNTYNKFYNESKCYINKVARINNINQFLINNINRECFKEIINSMEEILELSYEANITSNIENKEILLEKIIAKIKVIDFLINLSYDKMIINNKKYIKFVEKNR